MIAQLSLIPDLVPVTQLSQKSKGSQVSLFNCDQLSAIIHPQKAEKKTDPHDLILSVLVSKKKPVHIDFIAGTSGLTVGECAAYLLELELSGLVIQFPGARFHTV